MAKPVKRCSYVSDTESSSSYDDGDMELPYKYQKHNRKSEYPFRKTKCSSRNAIMARENRIKKKLYVQKLEQEVKILRKGNLKLNGIVDSHSHKIEGLQKHIKYLRSVLANSSDLRVLMNNIKSSTGMSVTTSLNNTLTLNNDCVSKREPRIAMKTAYPWNDKSSSSCDAEEVDDTNLNFPELDVLSEEPFSDILFDFDMFDYNSDNSINKEHSYTLTPEDDSKKNVGVCLHVANHRVSLEFCSLCSGKANEAWKKSTQ